MAALNEGATLESADDMPQIEAPEGDVAALRAFIALAAARPVHSNMLRWQVYYGKRCGRICCWSAVCGRIGCDGCAKSLTAPKPAVRYTCIECVPPEDAAADSWEPSALCHECFSTGVAPHEHARFLRVNESGVHSLVRRPAGVLPRWPWRPEHLPAVDPSLLAAAGPDITCAALSCDFTPPSEAAEAALGASVAVSMPGCTRGHGTFFKDDELGMRDSGWMCRACTLQWLHSTGHSGYNAPTADAPPPLACELCLFDRQMQVWEKEAKAGVAAVAKAWLGGETAGEALPDHPGKWTRAAEAAVAIMHVEDVPMVAASLTSAAAFDDAKCGESSWPAFCKALSAATRKLHPQPWIAAVFDRVLASAAKEGALASSSE